MLLMLSAFGIFTTVEALGIRQGVYKFLVAETKIPDTPIPNNLFVNLLYMLATVFYYLQHWLFSFEYYKVAVLFESTFTIDESFDFRKKVNNTKRGMWIANILVGLFLVLTLSIPLFGELIWIQNMYELLNIVIVIQMNYSLNKIKSFTASLDLTHQKFLKSEKLMKIHVATFTISAILGLLCFVFEIILAYMTKK